jgi:hypothetical protein
MAIETDIMAALFARVSSFAPAMPIAWPNVLFTPTSSGSPARLNPYLRVQFVPNTANRVLIGSDDPHQHVGLLQLSVYWAKGVGEADARARAAAVAAHFPCDYVLISGAAAVRITKRPDVRDMIVEDAAIQIPVMIDWEVYA